MGSDESDDSETVLHDRERTYDDENRAPPLRRTTGKRLQCEEKSEMVCQKTTCSSRSYWKIDSKRENYIQHATTTLYTGSGIGG